MFQDFMGESQVMLEEFVEWIYVQFFDGLMFFGFVNWYCEYCYDIKGVDVVIIRMERVLFMD